MNLLYNDNKNSKWFTKIILHLDQYRSHHQIQTLKAKRKELLEKRIKLLLDLRWIREEVEEMEREIRRLERRKV